jgi:competence ComEA-like helix-hairpin-helix protein
VKHTTLFFGILSVTLTVTVGLRATPAGQATGPQPPAKIEDPSTGLFVRMCNECHDAARIVSPRRTRADWEDILNKMIEKGASGSDADFENVFGYLQRNYGTVAVNRAPADEIAVVLSLSTKDAEAIVSFRKANGPFADFEALKKVPNIDLKKLDEHKEAVAF